MNVEKFVVYDKTIIDPVSHAYAIYKGSSKITSLVFTASGPTATKHQYVITFPSFEAHMPLKPNWRCSVVLKVSINITNVPPRGVPGGAYPPANAPLIDMGTTHSFTGFPLHRMIDSAQLMINGSPFTFPFGQIFDPVLRLGKSKNGRYTTCPSNLDNYACYNDSFGATDAMIGKYNNASNSYVPNGAFSRWCYCDVAGNRLDPTVASVDNTATAGMAGTMFGVPVCSIDGGATPIAVPTTLYCYIRLDSNEPIMMSPFEFFGDVREQDCGLSQVGSMILNLSLKSDLSDMFASMRQNNANNACVISSVSWVCYPVIPQIECEFYAPNIPLGITVDPAISVQPYLSFENPTIAEDPSIFQSDGGIIPPLNLKTISVQSLPIKVIPDGVLIWMQPKFYSNLVTGTPNWSTEYGKFRYPITNLRIGFGMNTLQLQDFTPEQLYWLSVENGVDIDYIEWYGNCNNKALGVPTITGVRTLKVPLCGSLVYLKMGKDVILDDASLASGVHGNFLLNVQVTCRNHMGFDINQTTQLYVVPIYSSFIVSQRGQTIQKTVIINQDDVLQCEKYPEGDNPRGSNFVTTSDLNRLVGGGIFDKLSSIVRKGVSLFNTGKNIYDKTKPFVSEVVKKLPDGQIRSVAKSIGYGKKSGAGKLTGSQLDFSHPVSRLMN